MSSCPPLSLLALQPDACATSFDAVSMIRGELFFFKSRYVWRLRERRLQPGYPALASRHWRGIPDHVDAACEDESGNIWFFQGWQPNVSVCSAALASIPIIGLLLDYYLSRSRLPSNIYYYPQSCIK